MNLIEFNCLYSIDDALKILFTYSFTFLVIGTSPDVSRYRVLSRFLRASFKGP